MERALSLRPWEDLAAAACATFYARNRAHMEPWEPRKDGAFFTPAYQAKIQEALRQEREADRHYAYAVYSGAELAGRVALSEVSRRAFQSAHLGYLTDVAMCGQGIATRAVAVVLALAFDEIALHRVQAAVMPRNTASLHVLQRCGFRRIGLSPRYLRIDERWEDHLLFAITAEEFSGAPAPR